MPRNDKVIAWHGHGRTVQTDVYCGIKLVVKLGDITHLRQLVSGILYIAPIRPSPLPEVGARRMRAVHSNFRFPSVARRCFSR